MFFLDKKNSKSVENIIQLCQTLVDKARLRLVSFFVICFCSPFLLFDCFGNAQNTEGVEMQMNN